MARGSPHSERHRPPPRPSREAVWPYPGCGKPVQRTPAAPKRARSIRPLPGARGPRDNTCRVDSGPGRLPVLPRPLAGPLRWPGSPTPTPDRGSRGRSAPRRWPDSPRARFEAPRSLPRCRPCGRKTSQGGSLREKSQARGEQPGSQPAWRLRTARLVGRLPRWPGAVPALRSGSSRRVGINVPGFGADYTRYKYKKNRAARILAARKPSLIQVFAICRARRLQVLLEHPERTCREPCLCRQVPWVHLDSRLRGSGRRSSADPNYTRRVRSNPAQAKPRGLRP